ncbi:MAG TPA: hypothetical protein VLC74_12860 [Rhizomicrobium sp.]|nr:hypothetical protein [Rhizomicrobium sp.]
MKTGFRIGKAASIAALTSLTALGSAKSAADFGRFHDADACLSSDDTSDFIQACLRAISSRKLNRTRTTYALNNLAIGYEHKDDWNTALKVLTTAIQLEDDGWVPLLNRSQVYLQLGEAELALADMKHATELASCGGACLRACGRLYLEQQNFVRAGEILTRAVLLDTKDARSLLLRSVAKQHLADEAGAAADLASAKQLDPAVANSAWSKDDKVQLRYRETDW